MTRATLVSLLAAAVLAAVPGAALAQDAGGQQYTDPLAGNPTTPTTPSTPSTSPSSTTTSSGSTSAASNGSSESATGSSASKPGIPRTGFPAGWLAFAGVLSIGGGLALRRVAADTRS